MPVPQRPFAGNVALVTLGCAKNLVDSEVMLGSLVTRGFQPVAEPDRADLIVVNTCAFLESAVEEGIDTILEMAKLKKTGRCRQLVVAGCMVERYRADLLESLPEVDQFISTDELHKVGELSETTEECFSAARRPYFLYDETMPRLRSTASHTAYLKIAEGCDRPCAFCIIPKIRGSFRSRAIDSVVREATSLLQDGVKELNLVAQDLTAYGSDFSAGRARSRLPELLHNLGKASEQTFWTRLLYAYPIGVNEELIRLIIESPHICNYLDLPLQHISHDVLKRMRRPLGERNTRALIEQVRTIAPQLALRTTFIVGFPGETDEDVESLRQFVSEGHFTHVGVFTYSQESESDAYHYDNQVPDELKEARRALIMEEQKKIVEARSSALIGKKVRVLIDGLHEESDMFLSSRAEWQGPETDGEVIINDVNDELRNAEGEIDVDRLAGKFGEVEITAAVDYDLVGTLVRCEIK